MPGFNHRRQFFTERRRSALDHEYYMEQALLLAREAARAGERELKLSAAAADGIPPAQAAHVTLRAIVETLRTLPPLAVTLRCPDEKTLCAHTVDWNMFYQEEKPE